MVSPDQPRRVILELDHDPDAIHGIVEHADGTREPFWGWLDLMSALERDVPGSPRRGASPGPSRDGS
jgi:hypothetical protein